eukprot:22681_1
MCGWWYAVNKNQEHGLIPYMYLEILSDYVDHTTITQHEFRHVESTVLAWDINNICKLIFQDQKSTTKEQNILLHSLRNLYIKCQKQDCRLKQKMVYANMRDANMRIYICILYTNGWS